MHNILVEKRENVVSLCKDSGEGPCLSRGGGMINVCHRLRVLAKPGATEGATSVPVKPPGIIVKLVRRVNAKGLLQERKVKRNLNILNTNDLGMTLRAAEVVYLNKCLAPGRCRLFNTEQQAKKDKGYTYIWIREGGGGYF